VSVFLVEIPQKNWGSTVDGQNPAPPRMMIIPLFTGFEPSQVVQDFVHQQYHPLYLPQTASFFCWVVGLACHLSIGSNTKSWADVAGSGKPSFQFWGPRFVRIFVGVVDVGCKDSYMLVVVSNIVCFHPDPWENEPHLTSIFFNWAETTN